MIDTKSKILDAAERLFALHGYDATSLRQVIAQAGVNLAAVHYHFGSKQELLDQIVLRKAGPVNQARQAALDRVEAKAGSGRLKVEPILGAFLRPMAEAASHERQFARLMGRLHAEGVLPQVVSRTFHPVLKRFFAALQRALPALPEREFLWRVHFMMGAMAHTMCGNLEAIMPGSEAEDFPVRVERLLAFLSAGFRAPVSRAEKVGGKR